MIQLPETVTKEGRAKNIPINRHAAEVLKNLPIALSNDYVITYQGEPMNNTSSLKKQYPDTCKKAGLPYGRKAQGGTTFHDIRRTVKTNMAKAGVNRSCRDVILGHALQGMDRHYVKLSDEDLGR